MHYAAITLHITPCNFSLALDLPWRLPIPVFLGHREGLEYLIRRQASDCSQRIQHLKAQGYLWQVGRQIFGRFFPFWTHTLRGAGVYDGQHLQALLAPSPWPPYQYWLEVVDMGLDVERIYLGAPRLIFGRLPENRPSLGKTLKLPDVNLAALAPSLTSRISRHHFLIERRGGAFYIQDLGSRNGTFLNGRLLSQRLRQLSPPVQIQPGDEIAVGKRLTLVFRQNLSSPMTADTESSR